MTEDKNFLPHFINEQIYVVDNETPSSDAVAEPEAVAKPIEVAEPEAVYEAEQPERKEEPIPSLQFTGHNTNGVVILVNSIAAAERAFLEKILSAVKLELDACCLVSLENNSDTRQLDQLKDIETKHLLAFGTANAQLPFSLGKSYEVDTKLGYPCLSADGLAEISADTSKKKQLWGALQTIFLGK